MDLCVAYAAFIARKLTTYSLEFNVQQMVLTDLAASVGASKDDSADETVQAAVDAVTSGVVTRAESEATEKVYMVCSISRLLLIPFIHERIRSPHLACAPTSVSPNWP